MSSDEEAFGWFLYENEMSEDDEDKKESSDDSTLFPRRCPICGSKLKWNKKENRLICPKCRV